MPPVVPLMLLTACIISVYTDLKYRIIPNKLTIPLLVSGVVYHGIIAGWSGVTNSITGITLGMLLLVIPALMGGMGGGDLKLLMAIGAWGGPLFVIRVFIIACLTGALWAVFLLIKQGLLIKTLITILRSVWMFIFSMGKIRLPITHTGQSLPYAICLSLGTLLTIIM